MGQREVMAGSIDVGDEVVVGVDLPLDEIFVVIVDYDESNPPYSVSGSNRCSATKAWVNNATAM